MYPTTWLNMTTGNVVFRKQCNFASFRLFATADHFGGKIDLVTCVIVAFFSRFIRCQLEWLPMLCTICGSFSLFLRTSLAVC